MASTSTPLEVPVRGLPDRPGPVRPVDAAAISGPLRDALAPRTRRLGYLGAFFAYAARQPAALRGFVEFSEALKEALPDDVAEVVALAVSAASGNDYERTQHERLSARLGYSPEWIRAVQQRSAGNELTTAQAAALRLVDAMLRDTGRGVRSELATVVELLGEETAVGVLLLVGRYVAHAHVANALELTSPVAGTGGSE